MTVKSVRATITLQIFPYLNNGQLCKKIAEDAKKIAEGFQVRDVIPTSGTVSFVFKNLNDSLVYAKELVKLLRGLDCRVNLIRFHSIPGVDLSGADDEAMLAFRDYLTSHGVFSTIRASRGEDIFAACGMLSTMQRKE